MDTDGADVVTATTGSRCWVLGSRVKPAVSHDEVCKTKTGHLTPAKLLTREYHSHVVNAGRQDRKHVCDSAMPRQSRTNLVGAGCGTTREFTSEY